MCSDSLESILATLSDCSLTSPFILALRVLGLRSTLLCTFPIREWLVLCGICNSLRDLKFLLAFEFSDRIDIDSTLSVGFADVTHSRGW
jgi:hypothetical protein